MTDLVNDNSFDKEPIDTMGGDTDDDIQEVRSILERVSRKLDTFSVMEDGSGDIYLKIRTPKGYKKVLLEDI